MSERMMFSTRILADSILPDSRRVDIARRCCLDTWMRCKSEGYSTKLSIAYSFIFLLYHSQTRYRELELDFELGLVG